MRRPRVRLALHTASPRQGHVPAIHLHAGIRGIPLGPTALSLPS
jgi:hypothetical protein